MRAWSGLRQVPRWSAPAALLITFTAAQGSYLLLGVRFDASPLDYGWQFIDVALMRTRLLESCFYLHGQPPGFNLFLGAVIKLFGASSAGAFHVLFLAMGFVLYAACYRLQRVLGVSRGVAFVLSTFFMASPAFVQYEHYLFYTLPIAAILTLSALCFFMTVEDDRSRWPVCFFALLVLLCWVRSLFHPMYFVAAGALLVGFARQRRQVLAIGLASVLVVGALFVKNELLFGRFVTSTWLGMNAWRMIGRQVASDDCRKLVEAGELSDVSLVRPFSPIGEYPARFRGAVTRPDVPLLSAPFKSNGEVNFNHEGYIAISDQYLRDSLSAVRLRPRALAVGLASSWFIYFTTAADYQFFIEPNVSAIAPVKRIWDIVVCGKIPTDLSTLPGFPYSQTPRYPYLLLLVGLPLVAFFGLNLLWKGRCGPWVLERAQRGVTAYLCLTILYVAFVGNLFEAGENNRFRFETDPMSLALLGVFLSGRLIPLLSFRRRLSPRI